MKLELYQIWHDQNSKPAQNSGLKAFDCRDNPEFLKREIAHLIRFYDEIVKHADNDCYFALLSPRFNEKTGLTIAQVKNFVSQNPNQDVYLFNPFPTHVYTYMNVWDSGEAGHSGLKKLTQHLFDTANIDFNVYATHRNNMLNTVYCNYWIASKEFFDDFISFVKHLDLTIDKMPEHEKAEYFSDTNYHTKACFYPFIFERLISSFLILHNSYNVKPYTYSRDAVPFNSKKRIDKLFYSSDYRLKFDAWEEKTNDIETLKKGYILVKNILRPEVSIFPFKFLNQWANSILKRTNLWMLPKTLSKIEKIDNNISSILSI